MESNEEYLLRVLRRTNAGLQDSLIPAHGAKLTKLVDRFERAESVTREVQTLMNVQGFTKCAVAMMWLLDRTRQSTNEFAPEQFESDILLLNEKLFEAFLNQPFDMPDFGRPVQEQTVQHSVQEIQMSADEFFPTGSVKTAETDPAHIASATEPQMFRPQQESQPTPSSTAMDAFESALLSSPADSTASEGAPSLADSMTAELYETMQRLSQSCIEFRDKMQNERAVATAVIRVAARNGLENASAASNILVSDFYQAFLKLIAYSDEQGKIKSEPFAIAIHDIGDRLKNALGLPSGGVTMLKNTTAFLSDPKGVLSK